jgi:hypothetical protein
MVKRAKLPTIFLILLLAIIIPVAFISGCTADNNTPNTNVANTPITNVAVKGMYPQYPQYYSPDIELHTSYISDTLEAGKTYVYKVQVKNVDNKSITIEPRLSANYPIIYPMATQGASGQASGASTTSNAQASTNAPATISTPIPINAPAVSSGSAVSSAMPMMPYGTNGQAFDNDAVNISAPSTIKAGEVVDTTITITVPENATGNYYSAIDMNVNKEENNPYNPQLSLSFTVQQPLVTPFVKSFSTTTDAPILIDISADTYNSDMGTRISPAIKDPAFIVGLTRNSNPVNLTLVKTVESGNVGSGIIYPKWVSATENTYQSYGVHYVQTCMVQGAIGDWKLSVLPKNTNNFGYSITIGSSDSSATNGDMTTKSSKLN